jgi:hypothetical protein
MIEHKNAKYELTKTTDKLEIEGKDYHYDHYDNFPSSLIHLSCHLVDKALMKMKSKYTIVQLHVQRASCSTDSCVVEELQHVIIGYSIHYSLSILRTLLLILMNERAGRSSQIIFGKGNRMNNMMHEDALTDLASFIFMFLSTVDFLVVAAASTCGALTKCEII